jgi:alpha-glucuronidase
MQALKAHVRSGHIVIDEPTDLPEGTEVLVNLSDDWDDLDDKERAEMHREIAASIQERRAGARTFSAEEVLAELGSRT